MGQAFEIRLSTSGALEMLGITPTGVIDMAPPEKMIESS